MPQFGTRVEDNVIQSSLHTEQGSRCILLIGKKLQQNCRAQDNTPSKESTNKAETDAAGDVLNTTKTENNREKQSTQYLTRFGNVPTSSGQGTERVY